MKILLVTNDVVVGGAQRALVNLARGLTQRNHDVQLVLLDHLFEYALPPTLNVHTLTKRGERMPRGWFGKRQLTRKLRSLHASLTQEAEFDVVISTLPLADEVVSEARLENSYYRIATNLSAEIKAMGNLRKTRRRVRRYRRIYDGQKLIAVSNGVATDLHDEMGYSGAEITTIYNPFDFEEIRSLSKIDEPELPNEPFIIHAGRFDPQKRHDLLLDAFKAASLPHRLVLLTPPSNELKEMISSRDLGQKVTVAGFQKNPFPWYAAASAFVLSSDWEGMPNVLIEALACGTPVVSTDCPSGPGELLQNEMKRWLVPRDDTEALAERMREVVLTKPTIDPSMLTRFSKDAALDAVERLGSTQNSSTRPMP
jgi:glycosyltransferase involved in cell wall biosynthesis